MGKQYGSTFASGGGKLPGGNVEMSKRRPLADEQPRAPWRRLIRENDPSVLELIGMLIFVLTIGWIIGIWDRLRGDQQ